MLSRIRSCRPDRIAGILLAFVCLAMAPSATAQPRPGDRIRLQTTATRAWQTGSWVRAGEDSLTISLDARPGGASSLAFSDVARLQTSNGRRRNPGRGILFGALVGLVSGAVATGQSDPDQGEWDFISDEFVIGVMVGAGAVAGAIVGLLVKSEKWSDATLPVTTVRLDSGGAGVGLVLAW